jgi:hypothetical protein
MGSSEWCSYLVNAAGLQNGCMQLGPLSLECATEHRAALVFRVTHRQYFLAPCEGVGKLVKL